MENNERPKDGTCKRCFEKEGYTCPECETIQVRAEEYAFQQTGSKDSKKDEPRSYQWIELKTGFIAGAESQDALCSEEVEKLKSEIMDLGSKLTAVSKSLLNPNEKESLTRTLQTLKITEEANEALRSAHKNLSNHLSSLTAICDKMESQLMGSIANIEMEWGEENVVDQKAVLAEYASYKNSLQ